MLPIVEVREVFGPGVSNAAAFEFVEQDMIQLATGQAARARQVLIRLEGCVVLFSSTNTRVRARPRMVRDYGAIACFGPESRGSLNGLPVDAGLLVVVPPGRQPIFVAEPGYESASIFFRTADLAQYVHANAQPELQGLLEGDGMIRLEPGKAGKLFAWAKRLATAALETPDMFDLNRDLRNVVKREMCEVLLDSFAASSLLKPSRNDKVRFNHGEIVQIAEQFVLAHTHEPIYVQDLCKKIGVSERTLGYAFAKVIGTSPMAYLMRLRLHRVRESLLRNSTGSTTVAQEALNWGFWHFGDFAKAYKECFGELPSDTLRRGEPIA